MCLLGPYLFISSELLPALEELGMSAEELAWISDERYHGKACRLLDNEFCVQFLSKTASEIYGTLMELFKEMKVSFHEESYHVADFSDSSRKVFFAIFGTWYNPKCQYIVRKVKSM